ncbi:MAG TPA: winged helix-turn-helix domain-containing protein [Methylocystis sp.]|jgi:DNA-binding winged helix-turn-helix (wHTH) protein
MRDGIRRFAGFTYSPRKGLWRGGVEIPLGPQARQLLELLLEADGGGVTRQEISARLWPNRPPSDASIDRCVYLLRKPLREAGFGDLVATTYGRGLSLRAEVEVDSSAPAPPARPPTPMADVFPTSDCAADRPSGFAEEPTAEMVEFSVGDIVVRVGPDVKEDQLARILRAVRAARVDPPH